MSTNVPPSTGARIPPSTAAGQPGSAHGIPPRPVGAPRTQAAYAHVGPGGIPPRPSAPPNVPPPTADGGAPAADMPPRARDPRFGYSSAAPNSSRVRKAALIKETLLGTVQTIKAILHDGPMPNTQPGAPDGQSYSASYPQHMQPNQGAQGRSMWQSASNVFIGLLFVQTLGTGAIASMLTSMLPLGALALGAGYLWHRFRQPPRDNAGAAQAASPNDMPPTGYPVNAGGQQPPRPAQPPQYGPPQQPQYGPPQPPLYGQPQQPQYGQPQQPPRPQQPPQYGPPQPFSPPALSQPSRPALPPGPAQDPRTSGWPGPASAPTTTPPRREPRGFLRTSAPAEETPASETP